MTKLSDDELMQLLHDCEEERDRRQVLKQWEQVGKGFTYRNTAKDYIYVQVSNQRIGWSHVVNHVPGDCGDIRNEEEMKLLCIAHDAPYDEKIYRQLKLETLDIFG